ncbi:hypothetical protein C6341_g11414 [Phytophthora cactorum]|nr:hypothetical protein PC122_g13074 [Phytophthora cactorum]KAG3168209.1 hypothetical protein C6341_g11414 [Phytophthora cactorum]
MLLLTKLQRYSRRQLAVALLGFSLFLAIIGQIQVLPVLFVLSIPVLLFFRWVFRQQQHHGVTDREIEQLFRTFLGGALIIPVLALVAQLTLGPLLASLCFFDQRSSILDQLHKYFQAPGDGRPAPVHNMKLGKMLMSLKVDKTVGYFLFLFCMAFIVAGLVEEFLKYWVVQGTCCCGSSRRGCCIRRLFCCCKAKSGSVPAFSALKQRQQRHGALRGMMCHPSRLLFYHRPHANHAFVVFLAVVAGALGFSVMENSAYSLLAPTFRDKIETALLRSISSAPLHCICGGITGVRMAERLLAHRQGGREERGTNAAKADLGRCRTKITVILPAVLIHGTFDMQLFLLMALVTPKIEATHRTFYHVVLPTILCSIVLLASFVYLRRKLHVMENKMNETRYMHVAVDLESGQRLGAVNGGFEMEFFGNDDDDSDAEDEAFTQEHEDPVDDPQATSARKMQFEPPTKQADVTVNIADGDNSNQGVDSNGIVTGRWKTGLFGFTDSIVPNGVMSCCCPGLVVAQISARLGLMPFYHVLGIFGGLYLLAIISVSTHSGFFDFLFWLCAVISALCMMRLRWRIRTLFSIPGSHAQDAAFSFCCGCCSVAQMASHVESYEPGTFAFAPRATLPGYSLS